MNQDLARKAGFALSWRAVQHVGVKLIYLVRLVVLARLLAPADFGLLAIAVVAVEFMMQVTNFGMVPAIVQRPHVEREHYDVAWSVGLVRVAFVSLAVASTAPWIAAAFDEPRSTGIIRAISLRPVLQAAASIGIARLTRELQFRRPAILWLVEALVSTVVAVVLARPLGVWALVISSLAGPAVFTILSYVAAPYRPRLRFRGIAIAELIRFGRWVFATGLIALIGRTVLEATISRQVGVAELGLYTLAARLAFLPAEATAEVVGAVAFPLFSRIQSDPIKTATAFRSLFTGLLVVVLPAVGLILALAPSLVSHVLGEKWEGSVPIIGILAAVSAVGLLGDTAVPMLQGAGQPQLVTLLEGAQTTCLIVLVWVLAPTWGVTGVAFAWLPAVSISQLLCAVILVRICPACFEGLGTAALAVVVASTAGSLVAAWIDGAAPGIVGLILGSCFGLLTVVSLLLIANRALELGLLEALGKMFPRIGALLARW